MAEGAAPAEREIVVNGLRLRYRDWGGDADLAGLALHGFGRNAHSWDEVAPGLRESLRLLAFDQRGHGRSDWCEKVEDYTRDAMVSDIDAIVVGLGLERPVVIGHSMGGMNAMTWASRNPSKVRALVLVDVGPEVRVDGAREVAYFVAGPYVLDSLDAWVEHTHAHYPWRSRDGIRARLEVSLRDTQDGRLAKQYDERFRRGFAGVIEDREDLWDVARRLKCPTLLVQGGSSPVLPLAMAEDFAAEVDAVRLVSIPGAGHSVAGDRPVEFVRATRAFLDAVLGTD